MHVGYTAAFQNPYDALSDQEVYAQEHAPLRPRRRARLRVAVDGRAPLRRLHHVPRHRCSGSPTGPASTPTCCSARASIVLPWHDPLRVAEQVALLDNLSGGRMIFGIGRGLARIEYEGFRVDMNTSRERLVEYMRLVLDALETGYMEYDNEFGTQPRRQIRPEPAHSFRGRAYAAAVSPESMPIMAELGIGVLVIPQKPWDAVIADLAEYRAGLQRGQRQRRPAAAVGRQDLRRRERGPGRGDGPQVDRRELRLGHAPLRVRLGAPPGREGLRVLHRHHQATSTATGSRAPSTTT